MSYFTDRGAVLEGGLKKVWNSKHTDTQEIDGGLGGSDVQTSELVSYILPPPKKKRSDHKAGFNWSPRRTFHILHQDQKEI